MSGVSRFHRRIPLFLLGALLPAHPQDAPPMTLHVYANLIQIPVLVLSPAQQPIPPVDPGLFAITLNSGRPFRPAHVRMQGDDPITLAILLDSAAGRQDLLSLLPEAIAALIPATLHPTDRVLVYSFDCHSIRSSVAKDAPAAGPLKESLQAAIRQYARPGPNAGSVACNTSIPFLNAVIRATQALSQLPGRRVLLAVTAGSDQANSEDWIKIKDYAVRHAVTIFALAQSPLPRPSPSGDALPLDMLCQLSGGLVLHPSGRQLPASLKLLFRMIRERYILEFPRPAYDQPGPISVLVTLGGRKAFIRPSGLAVPMPAPGELANPAAPIQDPATTPDVGSRRMLPPPSQPDPGR